MDLITLMLSRRIGNLEERDWEKVLAGTHESLNIKKSGQGMLMLNNNVIIKCVIDYYRQPSDPNKKIKHSNAALKCHYVQENLNIVGLDAYQCELCHLRCLNRKKTHDLIRAPFVK